MKRYRTERELLLDSQFSLFQLEKEMTRKKYSIEEFGEMLPGMLHLNRAEDLMLTYFNSWAVNRFEKTVEEVAAGGMEFMISRFEPGTAILFSQSLQNFVKGNDAGSSHGFFQKLRFNPNREFEWVYTSSKLFEKGKFVFSYTSSLADLKSNTTFLFRALEDNLFLRKNFLKLQSLTKREKQILQLVAAGGTSREISERLYISSNTVSTHRKNIAQKLDLKHFSDWIRFTSAFDMKNT